MNPVNHWPQVRRICNSAFGSSLHYALASINEDGTPHVTPIGSLLLREPGHAIYFERFTRHMPQNFRHSNKVCVLAVNSGRWFWLTSLIRGRFSSPPALRLHGTVGEPREATAEEIALWQRRVRRLRHTKGHALIWAGMAEVRDIQFTRVEEIHIGAMTRGLWSEFFRTDARAA